jgi:CTP:molybdopterin cytidylyltransferase MocA
MSLSLRLGFGALGDDVAAAMILLGDQLRMPAATVAAILAARGNRPVVAATAEGVLAPPVLIERTHFGLIDDLAGDVGLRRLLQGNPNLVTAVPIPFHAPDVNTPEDVARLAGDG